MIKITESGRYETTVSKPMDGYIIWRLWKDDDCLYVRAIREEK